MRRVAQSPNIKPGDRFGRLVVTGAPEYRLTRGRNGKRRRWFVSVHCDCGTDYVTSWRQLQTASEPSCGCRTVEAARLNTRTHGGSGTRLYGIRRGMITRCEKPTHNRFRDYGGRGIKIDPVWRKSFEAFRQWAMEAGYNDSLEIDRIDNDGDYEPSNCRWVSHSRNNRNMRRTRWLSAFGESKSLPDWVEDHRCAVSALTLTSRLGYGWSVEKAIVTPARISKTVSIGFIVSDNIGPLSLCGNYDGGPRGGVLARSPGVAHVFHNRDHARAAIQRTQVYATRHDLPWKDSAYEITRLTGWRHSDGATAETSPLDRLPQTKKETA